MIDPKKITPLLSNMSVDREIGRGPNGVVYQVTRRSDGKKMAVKHISIPLNEAQTRALMYAGAVTSEAEAQRYYASMMNDIKAELLLLNKIPDGSNLLKFRGYQVDQKFAGIGYDVYLLSDYCSTLPYYIAAHPLTKLQAVNLAIDLCSGLEQLRSAGLIHRDVQPSNVFLGGTRRFMLGDLGLAKLEDLPYSTMPDGYVTEYTAPEVTAEDTVLSETMDIYSVGRILYEIYNGNILPEGSSLPAPAYADEALSEIILRACARNPKERYASPSEMKQAFVLYMQRNRLSGEPLIPPQPEEDDETDTEVDVAVIAATVAAGQIAEDLTSLGELPNSPAGTETDGQAEAPQSSAEMDPGFVLDEEPIPEDPRVSLNTMDEDDLLVPADEEISVEDFLASLRSTPGLEVLTMDSEGNTTVLPGYETEETMPNDTEYVSSADSRGAAPENGAAAESPAAAEPSGKDAAASDVESQLIHILESSQNRQQPVQPAQQPAQSFEAPTRPPVRQDSILQQQRTPNPAYNGYSAGSEGAEDDYDGYEEGSSSGTWKKVLITVIILVVVAAAAFALYVFETDTVSNMDSVVLSSSSVEVTANLRKDSSAVVVCSADSGEAGTVSFTDGSAVFTGLSPSTTYTFTLKSSASKLFLGSKSVTAQTKQLTSLTSFAASSVSAVGARLVLAGTGEQPDAWIVTATSEDGGTVTAESSTYEIYLEGLTPNTMYTAEVSRSDGDELGGTTVCTFSTMGYTVLSDFDVSSVNTTSATVSWTYTGTVPDTWTLTCEGSDGSAKSEQVSGTECTFTGLTGGVTYTVSLYCDSLQDTEMSTISVGIPSVTIDSVVSSQNEDGDIEVSWEYSGSTTPGEWSISYVYDCETAVTAALVTSSTNSVVLTDLLPNANYTITVTNADGLYVSGNNVTTCLTAAAGTFTKYGCTDVSMSLYDTDDRETPVNSFTPSQHLYCSIQASYDVTDEDKHVDTLYIIRNAYGTPVYVYEGDRSWSGNYLTTMHSGEIPDMPQTPGSYTLEVYFDGDLMASAGFTVTG